MTEKRDQGADLTSLIALSAFAAPVVVAVWKALVERRERLNRYQVAVAASEPVAEVAPILEEMVQSGVVEATGDADSPNTREYQLRDRSQPRTTPSADST